MLFLKKYDVFISYAIEDKFPVAETIASNLKQNGIKVWYVGNELKVGDLISTVISTGLRKSNYCILILSPFYIRHWTVVELYRFIEKEQLEKKILILPVWHNIDYDEAKAKYPIIADRYAVSTQTGMAAVCENLYKVIREKKKNDLVNKIKLSSIAIIFFLACATAFFFLYQKYSAVKLPFPSKQVVENCIQKRTDDFQIKLENNLQKKIATGKGKIIPLDSIITAYNRFMNLCKHERNEYKFTSENFIASGSGNIENQGISISNTPYNAYGISTPSCYLFDHTLQFGPDTVFNYSFAILNKTPLSFVIDTLFESQGKVHARITYSQNIRSVEGTFIYPYKSAQLRKQQIQFSGCKPSEEYIFEVKNSSWEISGVK